MSLSAHLRQERDDFLTVINPSVSIRRLSKRTEFSLDYNLQNILYANTGSANDQTHLLSTEATGELLQDRVFLDLSLNRSTQNTSNSGNSPRDNLSISGDRNNVLRYSVSPYIYQRLGSFAELDASYEYDEIRSGSLNNNVNKSTKAKLQSGSDFYNVGWNLTFDDRVTNNSVGRSTRIRKLSAGFNYLLSRKLAVTAELGYNDNKFDRNSGNNSGSLWNLGLEWNLSTRTSLSGSYGDSFFGEDIKFKVTHRSKRSRTSLSFERIPSTTSDILREQQTFQLRDAFGDLIVNPDTVREISDLDTNIPQQSTEILIRSRLKGVYSLGFAKNSLNFSSSYEEADYQLSGESEIRRQANFGWNWNVHSRLTSSLNLGWSKNNIRSGRKDKFITAQYQLTYRFSRLINLNLGYRHVDRGSSDSLLEYDENRIFSSITKRF